MTQIHARNFLGIYIKLHYKLLRKIKIPPQKMKNSLKTSSQIKNTYNQKSYKGTHNLYNILKE